MTIRLFDDEVQVLSLQDLIRAKKAAGRPKDFFVLPQLEAVQEAFAEADEE